MRLRFCVVRASIDLLKGRDMASDPLSDNDSQDAAWDEITRLVDEVADLADTDPEWFIGRLGEWFREWSQDGLFTAIATA